MQRGPSIYDDCITCDNRSCCHACDPMWIYGDGSCQEGLWHKRLEANFQVLRRYRLDHLFPDNLAVVHDYVPSIGAFVAVLDIRDILGLLFLFDLECQEAC